MAGISSTITSGMAAGSIFAGIFGESYHIKDSHSQVGVLLSLGIALLPIFFIGDPFKGLIISQMVLVFNCLSPCSYRWDWRLPERWWAIMSIAVGVRLCCTRLLLSFRTEHYAFVFIKWTWTYKYRMMKIITYNVNGLRAAVSKGLPEWLGQENPDILCLQETKLQPDQYPAEVFEALGYKAFFILHRRRDIAVWRSSLSRNPIMWNMVWDRSLWQWRTFYPCGFWRLVRSQCLSSFGNERRRTAGI